MGAWGSGAFDNDDASDWVYALEEAEDFEVVRQALNVDQAVYLEAPEGAIALAAAEVVAGRRGAPEPAFGVPPTAQTAYVTRAPIRRSRSSEPLIPAACWMQSRGPSPYSLAPAVSRARFATC